MKLINDHFKLARRHITIAELELGDRKPNAAAACEALEAALAELRVIVTYAETGEYDSAPSNAPNRRAETIPPLAT